MSGEKIRIRGLKKSFGAKKVLDGVDLDVMPGTGMVVIGGSGTGKSVLIKCILGLLTADAGVIEIDGEDVLKAHPKRARQLRGQIGMLFQNGALFDSLPVWENVAFGLLAEKKIRRGQARDKAVWRRMWRDCRRRSFPAACKSASPWPAPSPRRRRSCFSMNPPPAWTRSWVL